MKAYWVLNYNITNAEAFEPYRGAALPLIKKLIEEGKAKILVVGDNVLPDTQEGNPGSSVVIVEFSSKEVAKEFYYSQEYQDVVKLRTDNSEGWSVIVDGRA